MASRDQYKQTRGYDIGLTIKTKTYDDSVESVRIVSSLSTAWQVISIVINIPPKDAILNKLYGEDDIKLSVKLSEQQEGVSEDLLFDLMMVSSDFDIPVSQQMVSSGQEDRSNIRLLCIPRPSFNIMTKFVNNVYGTHLKDKMTQKQIIEDLMGSDSGNLKMDTIGINEKIVEQVCIPPTTFRHSITVLDDLFGLFNGVPAVFCQYDGTVFIKNLTDRIKKSQEITIEQLTTDANLTDILKKPSDGKNYYTYDNITTSYIGNTRYAILGNTIYHVIKPDDKLYQILDQDLSTVIADYGIVDTNKKTPFNTAIAKRKKYYNEHGGDGENLALTNSMIARKIANLSTISFSIDRNIRITKLLLVGSCVKFKSGTAEYSDLTGKYILNATDINLAKSGGWQATAKLELFRTNKTL